MLSPFEQPSQHLFNISISQNTQSHTSIFTMNKTTQPLLQQDDEEEEFSRLSFCDLPISGAATPTNRPTTPSDHLFEFSSATAAAHSYYNDVIFCGKIIHEGEGDNQDNQLSEFEKRDYFATVKSQSLRKPSFHENRQRSASTRFSGDLAPARPKWPAADPVYHAQRVNISSLTSMSAKSRRRMFMFGPVKFKPEMELSSIKQRQAKMAAAAEKVSPPKSHWGVVKSSLRGRSHLGRVLARSLGCFPAASGGGLERWVGVAN